MTFYEVRHFNKQKAKNKGADQTGQHLCFSHTTKSVFLRGDDRQNGVIQKSSRDFINEKDSKQGRRRVLKSGPAEEIIECRRHERGKSTRGGEHPPPPRENFEFIALLCAFYGFYAFGTRFQSRFPLEKIFLGA